MIDLYTEIEVAQFLRISPLTLKNWRWLGRGPAVTKIGRTVRYSSEDLQTFLNRLGDV